MTQATSPKRAAAEHLGGSRPWREFLPAGVVAVAVLAMTPFLIGNPRVTDTSITIATFSIIALSLGMSYGLGGMLSLAQATFAPIGAYGSAILAPQWEISPWLGPPGAILVPMAVAYVMARLIVRLSPLALALATLAFSQLVYLAVNEGGELTGGYIGISGIPGIEPFGSQFAMHLLGWILVLLVLLVYIRIRRSNAGRALMVIGTDTVLAQSLGVSVNARLAAIFALSGGVAGIGGWYYAHVRGYLAPSSLSLDMSFMIAIAVIIGGRRTLIGPILGGALLVLLRDFVPGTTSHGMFYGAGLIVALLLFPEGIMGENWRMRFGGARRLGVISAQGPRPGAGSPSRGGPALPAAEATGEPGTNISAGEGGS